MNNEKNNSINNNKSEFLTKIKSIKHIKLIVILLLVAIIIFVVDYFVNTKKVESNVTMTETESRLSEMIEKIDNIDSCEVYINYENQNSFFGGGSNKIVGVLVVCKGKNTVSNKLLVLNALQKALNIKEDIIEILIL